VEPEEDVMVELRNETVFTWGAPPIKFGVGATEELGFDLRQLEARQRGRPAAGMLGHPHGGGWAL